MDEDAGSRSRSARCVPASKAGAMPLSHLRRFVKPALGNMAASTMSRSADIADALERHPCHGRYRQRPRSAMPATCGALFAACSLGRWRPVAITCEPRALLQPPEAAKEHARERRPIRGRDQDILAWPRPRRPAVGSPSPVGAQIPVGRHASLAANCLPAHRDELIDLDGEFPTSASRPSGSKSAA